MVAGGLREYNLNGFFVNQRVRKQAVLFVNKKQQKNFDVFDVPPLVPHGREAEQKFFGSFFQKRTASFLSGKHPTRRAAFSPDWINTHGSAKARPQA
jgi:hypothetical protein